MTTCSLLVELDDVCEHTGPHSGTHEYLESRHRSLADWSYPEGRGEASLSNINTLPISINIGETRYDPHHKGRILHNNFKSSCHSRK
jgi:hypothetical protein